MRSLLVLLPLLFGLTSLAFAGDRPPHPQMQTDAACRWEWRRGDGIGLWTETCPLKTGLWTVAFNASDRHFELKLNGDVITTVVKVFRKPAEEPISAILPDLKKLGAIPDTAECVFKPIDGEPTDTSGRSLYEIRPTGSRLKAFEATPSDEVPEPPCGDYAWSTHGRRTFRVDPSHPEAVIYVDEGQDGTMTAPETITFE